MRGVALSELVTQLKAELGDADEANTVADARYKKRLANKQSDLAKMFDWPFLKREWDLSVDSGDRYKDIPAIDTRGTAGTPNFEKKFCVYTYWNENYLELEYGIGPNQYNAENSDLDERLDPVQRWQVATNIGEATNDDQVEIWPIPVSLQTLRFIGQREVNELEDDEDKCDLDSLLIVYGVAAEELALRGQPNAPLVLRKFNERLYKIRGGQPASDEPLILGRQNTCKQKDVRIMVLAGGRPTSTYSGSIALANGQLDGSVLFTTALSYTPTIANLTISKPAGGFDIFGTLVVGSLTGAGFDFTLSAAPDSDNYKLHYIVTP